ncbi:MAG TPA: S8 family serine peptidase [Chloroflexota bacterium]|nr:S8 family serine peptidase [Chloroflexota bacterium]
MARVALYRLGAAAAVLLGLAVATDLFGVSASAQQGPATPETFAASARQAAAVQLGTSAGELQIVNQATARYPLSGATAFAYKVLDPRTGAIVGVTLDAQGRPVAEPALRQAESAQRETPQGRLHPELSGWLAAAPESAGTPVVIWLREGPYTPPARPQRGAPEARIATWQQQARQTREAAVTPLTGPVVARLNGLGVPARASTLEPFITATLTASQIRQVAGWGEVDTIYLSRPYERELAVSRPALNAEVVEARGITGSGVKVGIVEFDRVATSNPYLAGTTQDTTYTCGAVGDHITGVAGIIRSTHPFYRGIAPNATLWAGGSCSATDAELQAQIQAAVAFGVVAINNSWGRDVGASRQPAAMDRYYDGVMHSQGVLPVTSAGNRDLPCLLDGRVISPGLGYSVLTVGNFDTQGTPHWGGDTILYTCSSWVGPSSTFGDRVKPEVAAPGTNITSTTTSSPWVGDIGSGTSFAAPMVTGLAALVSQRTGLTTWPEALKAIIMAGATHNLVGARRLSVRDGVGGVVASRADDIAQQVTGGLLNNLNCGGTYPVDLANIPLRAGKRFRAVLHWDTNTADPNYALQPSADFDLSLYQGSTFVAGSLSFDNTYEVIDLVPPASGTYTLRLTSTRCDWSPVYGAWAWWQAPNKWPTDFSGDGQSDLVVWRPATGQWWVRGRATVPWGQSGDKPVPGDYDGDGVADYAVWRPATGEWWVRNSVTGAGGVAAIWGVSGDIPVPGDYDGDGRTDFAVWRPATGQWWVKFSSTGAGGVAALWGQSGDVPVPGDYDGDGKTDFAVWRPSTGEWWVRFSSTGAGGVVALWGASADIPVPGDYDGDGRMDYAVWRPATGEWWVRYASTGAGGVATIWGQGGDLPVPGDYNGDGKTDFAVWRPSTGEWWVRSSASGAAWSVPWGLSTDIPPAKPQP